MAVSRPFLIALAAAVVLMGAVLGMRLGKGSDEPSEPSSAGSRNSVAVGQAETVEPGAAPERAEPARSGAEPAPAGSRAGSVPRRVERALDARRVVVLFFSQGAADDLATRDAVRAARRLRGTTVFSDDVARLADYAGVVASLDISRAPAVVVVGPDGDATVEQGFLDAGSLEQRVRDARG